MLHRAFAAEDGGRHGDAYGLVLTFDEEGEGPEVYGRPEEDEGEEQGGHPVEAIGDGSPTQEGHDGSGGAADDDVLPGGAFEPGGVDEHVVEQAEPGQEGGQQVGCEPEDEEGAEAEKESENDGVAHADDAGHEGAFGGAAHLAVYVAVEHHVEDAGAAGGHVAADKDAEEGQPVGQAAGGDEHGADRGEEEEGDDFGLGEGQVVAPGGGGQTGGSVYHSGWTSLVCQGMDGAKLPVRGALRVSQPTTDQRAKAATASARWSIWSGIGPSMARFTVPTSSCTT